MDEKIERSDVREDNLAEGIAAVMAAAEELEHPEDLADLFLDELNRLWAEGPVEQAA
jgi:hypothetical protein